MKWSHRSPSLYSSQVVNLCAATIIVSMMALNPFHRHIDSFNANSNAPLSQDTKASNNNANISTDDVINTLLFQYNSDSNDNTNVNSTNDVISALLFQDSDSNDDTNVDSVHHHQDTRDAIVIINNTNAPSDINLDRRHEFL